jgi:hypothetical protein
VRKRPLTPPDGYDPHAEVFDLPCAAWFVGRINPQTLRRSQCPRSKVGAKLLFERAQLLAFIASRRSHQLAPVAA